MKIIEIKTIKKPKLFCLSKAHEAFTIILTNEQSNEAFVLGMCKGKKFNLDKRMWKRFTFNRANTME